MNKEQHPLPWKTVEGRNIADATGYVFATAANDVAAQEICDAANALLTPNLVAEVGFPKESGVFIAWYSDRESPQTTFLQTDYNHPNVIAWLKLPSLPKESEAEKAWKERRWVTTSHPDYVSLRDSFLEGFEAGRKSKTVE